MEYSFNTDIASQFGVDIAVFLNNIKFWTNRNLNNNQHIHDGLCWSYNTIPGFCGMFKFWSRHQIEHLIRKMKQLGIITTGNYNATKYDRTCWYALTLKGLLLFPELLEEAHLAKLQDSISEKSEMDVEEFTAWRENEVMHLGNFRDGSLRFPRPIPDSKPDTDITNVISDEKPEMPNAPKKPNNTNYSLKELKADNPNKIPDRMLEEWLAIRKDKKARVTQTAWDKINATLVSIEKEVGIKPQDAFQTMVANCWQSLDVKYFKDDSKRNGKPKQTFATL